MPAGNARSRARRRMRMWKKRGRPLWPWLRDIAIGTGIGAALSILIWATVTWQR